MSDCMTRFLFLRRIGFLLPLAIAGMAGAPAALSQEKIGIAVTIRNDVNGILSTRTMPINIGEDVFGKEIVKTGQESSAKLVFADSTNLAVGPNSSVTLDKFVYAGAADYKKATLQLVKGAFRFTTGNSDKRAYEINTGVATIGVRGTVVDILSQAGRTIAVLQEGVVLACSKSYQCTTLSHPGETAIITATSATKQNGGQGKWNFESNCSADPALCEVTQMASGQLPIEAAVDYTPYLLGGGAAAAIGGGAAAGMSNNASRANNPLSLPPPLPISP
jgi:hypothetical protein